MYLKEYIKKFENQKIKMYVDMDGVIADYEVGIPYDFDKKRPLISNISKLEDISKLDNVELFILSITRMNKGYEEKNIWLDKHAPFFKKENRVIISRESNDFISSYELKSNFIKEIQKDGSVIIVIDDDPRNLKEIRKLNEDIILLKDTALID